MKQSYIIHIASRKTDRNHLAKTVQLLKRQHCNKITHNYAAQEQERTQLTFKMRGHLTPQHVVYNNCRCKLTTQYHLLFPLRS